MKAQTPMSVMKPELDKLRAFSLLNFFALNGRPKKTVYVGSEDFGLEKLVSGAITFDYMAIFGLGGHMTRTEKDHARYAQSMAVCINYKTEQTVRASVVLSTEGNIEYSKSYTVPEFRNILKHFIEDNKACLDRNVLLNNYIAAFGIVTSASLNKAELNKIKEHYVKKATDLQNTRNRAERAQHDARKGIANAQTDTEKAIHIQRLKELVVVADTAVTEILHIVKQESRDIPAIARHHFFQELAKDRIYN